jgi:hypothetical protein
VVVGSVVVVVGGSVVVGAVGSVVVDVVGVVGEVGACKVYDKSVFWKIIF